MLYVICFVSYVINQMLYRSSQDQQYDVIMSEIRCSLASLRYDHNQPPPPLVDYEMEIQGIYYVGSQEEEEEDIRVLLCMKPVVPACLPCPVYWHSLSSVSVFPQDMPGTQAITRLACLAYSHRRGLRKPHLMLSLACQMGWTCQSAFLLTCLGGDIYRH